MQLENYRIYEKNTFINVATSVPQSQRRRTSVSVPAAFKVIPHEPIFGSKELSCGDASARKTPSSPCATTAFLSDGDLSSDAGSTADRCSKAFEAHAGAEGPAAAAASGSAERIPTPEQPRLSTKAKAFVSTRMAALRHSQACPHRAQVESMLATMQSAMASLGLSDSICATQTPTGWHVRVRVPLGAAAQSASLLLSRAKDALLRGAEQSACIYVLGHLAEPFFDTTCGFSATLGGMEDEGAACWDYYDKGFCHRGCFCKWAHARYQATVSVDVQL